MKIRKGTRVRIRAGWSGAGRVGKALAAPMFVLQDWVPVVWDDEEDPDFFKDAGLETYTAASLRCSARRACAPNSADTTTASTHAYVEINSSTASALALTTNQPKENHMTRSKMRKLTDTIPPDMPKKYIDQALSNVTNGKTRAKLRARIERRNAAGAR